MGRPPDPPDGQDPDPPNVLLAVRAVVHFLRDVDEARALASQPVLNMRAVALRHALVRLRDHLEGES
jgi:hypothetical protein